MTHRLLYNLRLVGNQLRVDSHRYVPFNPTHRVCDGLSEFQNVAALHHSHAKTDCRLTVVAEKWRGRVFVTAAHGCQIAQWHQSAIHADAHLLDIRDGIELTAHAHCYAVMGRFEDA